MTPAPIGPPLQTLIGFISLSALPGAPCHPHLEQEIASLPCLLSTPLQLEKGSKLESKGRPGTPPAWAVPPIGLTENENVTSSGNYEVRAGTAGRAGRANKVALLTELVLGPRSFKFRELTSAAWYVRERFD